MGTYTVYRLTFKTQLHLGRASGPAQQGNLGLEKTEVYIPADTLFSALCQTWATFYHSESLTAFLNGYTDDSAGLPFTLTSAFPFAHNVYLFPKPLTFTDRSKKGKRIQFVSDALFREIIAGNPPEFDEDLLMNGEKVWVSPQEKETLETSIEGKPLIWKTSTRPRVTLGSRSAGSEIWHIESVQFNKGCGLWFAAHFDSDETKQKIETCLRVLGDTGIGGERSAGYGLFNFTPATIEIPSVEAGNQFVTLSPICPQTPTELANLLTGDTAYTLNPSVGWISTTGVDFPRKQVMMFSEGSILNATEGQVGRLIDLAPEGWAHPVYRYGYAWQIGIKGTPK